MIAHLQEFLLANGKVKLPGAGFLTADFHPARYEVAERAFLPPGYSLQWQEEDDDFVQQRQMAFMAAKMGLSEEELFEQFHAMASRHQDWLEKGNTLDLGALGKIQRGEDGALQFSAPVPSARAYQELKAERVIRQGKAHQMVVGDHETTTTEMEAYYAETPEEKDRWWWLPLTIGIIALVLIFWKRYGA